MAPMSAADVIPADKLAELVEHIRTAARKRQTGTVLLRLGIHKGRIVRAAVVPDFDDAVMDVKAPICFEGEPERDAAALQIVDRDKECA
jgi:hypothetical protein